MTRDGYGSVSTARVATQPVLINGVRTDGSSTTIQVSAFKPTKGRSTRTSHCWLLAEPLLGGDIDDQILQASKNLASHGT